MTKTLWANLTAAYPALATTVGGESPLKFAVDEYEAGRCATVITKKDLAMDAKIRDEKECK